MSIQLYAWKLYAVFQLVASMAQSRWPTLFAILQLWFFLEFPLWFFLEFALWFLLEFVQWFSPKAQWSCCAVQFLGKPGPPQASSLHS